MKSITNVIGEKVNLNDNEIKFLNYLASQDDYDDGSGTLCGIPDIDVEGFNPHQIAGYISDIDRKHLIQILDGKEYSLGCDCIYLDNSIIEQL